MNRPQEAAPRLKVLDLTPKGSDAIKPAELIQVSGHHDLSLNARRAITLLWNNAHLQGVSSRQDYSIEIDDLKPAGHKGYEMVVEAIEALMKTILIIKLPEGGTRRVQFLGGNDLDDPDRPAGMLTYSFDRRLVEILENSTIWGKITLPVLMAFSSKYAVSLYENIAQMVNLKTKTFHGYTLEEFRDLLGVQPSRYKTFGELNKHVLKPAVAELNALAPFTVSVLPVKQGKKVTGIRIGWMVKNSDEMQDAFAELQRSKVGRKARIAGAVEHVLPPIASVNRLTRRAQAKPPKTS